MTGLGTQESLEDAPTEGKGPLRSGWGGAVPARTCTHTVGSQDAEESRTRGARGSTWAQGLFPNSMPGA